MNILQTKIYATVAKLYNDPLHRNSFFLMFSTAIMAGFGFFFWLISSRIYSQEEVGRASSLISLTNLLTSVASFGFPTALLRFLPKSAKPNEKISTSMVLTGMMAMIVSFVFWLICKIWLTELFPLLRPLGNFVLFLFVMVVATWQQIGDAIFISKKSAHWITLESFLFSALKLMLLLPLFALNGFGIFLSNFTGLSIATIISFLILIKRFHIVLSAKVDYSILQEIGRYSFGSYLIGLIGIIPGQILPALVAQILGAESAAHFFLALMMVSLLSVVPLASSQVLFAAGSANPSSLRSLTIKSLRMQLILVFSSLICVWFFSGWIFSWFGSAYAIETTSVLRILSFSVIATVVSAPLVIRLRIKRQLRKLTCISFVGMIAVLLFCYIGGKQGLNALGLGYVAGQVFISTLFFVDWKLNYFKSLVRRS